MCMLRLIRSAPSALLLDVREGDGARGHNSPAVTSPYDVAVFSPPQRWHQADPPRLRVAPCLLPRRIDRQHAYQLQSPSRSLNPPSFRGTKHACQTCGVEKYRAV